MTATGIGAPVRRKEDQRFVTGQGRYVDDFDRPGQAYDIPPLAACPRRDPVHRHGTGHDHGGRDRRLHGR